MHRVGDKVTVKTSASDPVRIQTHRHALVRRVDGDQHWVGHDGDYPEVFGPFPAAALVRGWGRSVEAETAVWRLCSGMGWGS